MTHISKLYSDISQAELSQLKSEIRKLATLVRELTEFEFKEFPQLKIIDVTLHNLAFDGRNCEDYGIEGEINDMNSRIEVIEKLCAYNSWYFTDFIVMELDMIILVYLNY